MNVVEALNSRITSRAFKPDPVSKETIQAILEAATRAPHQETPSRGSSLLPEGKR